MRCERTPFPRLPCFFSLPLSLVPDVILRCGCFHPKVEINVKAPGGGTRDRWYIERTSGQVSQPKTPGHAGEVYLLPAAGKRRHVYGRALVRGVAPRHRWALHLRDSEEGFWLFLWWRLDSAPFSQFLCVLGSFIALH